MRGRWQPIAVGLAGGLASGLLGVGGGIVIVPLLVAQLGLAQRQAHATSLAAIVPAALVGAAIYAAAGELTLPAAAALASGSLLGAPLGILVLARTNERLLAGLFLLFSVFVGVRLLIG